MAILDDLGVVVKVGGPEGEVEGAAEAEDGEALVEGPLAAARAAPPLPPEGVSTWGRGKVMKAVVVMLVMVLVKRILPMMVVQDTTLQPQR